MATLWLWPSLAYADDPTFTDSGQGLGNVDSTGVNLGDLDGDGDLDAFIVTASDRENLVWFNNGYGVFQESGQRFGKGLQGRDVALGDLDGDGDLDAFVANALESGQPNNVWLNNGDGVFFDAEQSLGNSNSRSVTLGDLDGDGDLDAFTANMQANQVWLNNGEGNFVDSGETFDGVVSNSRSVALADLDGDGDLDAFVVNESGQGNEVWLNAGNADFSSTGQPPLGSSDSYEVRLGDLDGDGDLDAFVTNVSGQANKVWLNRGDATFDDNGQMLGDSRSGSVDLGDLDGDGDLDSFVSNTGDPSKVWLNDGFGQFTSTSQELGEARNSDVALGDLDGDGDLDAFVSIGKGSPDKVYLNDGGGLFNILENPVLGSEDSGGAAVGDVDSDGDLDVFVANEGQSNTVWFNSDGLGTFGNSVQLSGSANSTDVALGDLNGDGDLDAFVANGGQANTVWVNVNGQGVFTVSEQLPGASDSRGVALGDLDADGDLDAFVVNKEQPNTVWLNSDGFGTFSNNGQALGNARSRGLALGDFDGDGDLDAFVVNDANQPNRVWLNNSLANFTDSGQALGSSTSTGVAAGDLDGDGDLDAFVCNDSGQANKVWLNDGLANFTDSGQALANYSSRAVALGDIDGDGDLDALVSNTDQLQNLNPSNRIWLNDGQANFSLSNQPLGGSDTRWVALADLNRDGRLDAFVANHSGQANRVYLNNSGKPTRYATSSIRPGPTQNANFYSTPAVISDTIPLTYTLLNSVGDIMGRIEAHYSLDGGDNWQQAEVASDTATTNLNADNPITVMADDFDPSLDAGQWEELGDGSATTGGCGGLNGNGLNFGLGFISNREARISPLDLSFGGTVQFALKLGDDNNSFLCETVEPGKEVLLQYATNVVTWTTLATYTGGDFTDFNRLSVTIPPAAHSAATRFRWIQPVSAFLSDHWALDDVSITAHQPVSHIYQWDTFTSGVFGQSDNVVIRLEAYPQPVHSTITGTYHYTNSVPGPFQWPYASATTFPFRVRGTQVQVISGTQPVSGAIVYRLPKDENVGGFLLGNESSPFVTDANGYLSGRGRIDIGDRLLALAPVPLPSNASERFSTTLSLYYTNIATVTETGLETLISNTNSLDVSQPGVQVLQVSAQRPLMLFDLDVSLEWDASNDPAYLQQLEFDLKRASQHLFDFTDGQVALGDIWVYQNADNWSYSHINVHATNRLRPYATIGGVVLTDTLHVIPELSEIGYGVGQVHMGSTWNRYGNPAQSIGVDWPVILAHELGHYLLFLEDTYLGLEPFAGAELLKAVDDCLGSAMGDVYNINNTEFVFDDGTWDSNCAETLANQELGRDEWEIMQSWYPWLQVPSSPNPGPSQMPYELTTVSIFEPLTPTNTLEDPTFYLDYGDNEVGTSEARAFLLRNTDNEVGTPATTDQYEYMYDLGNPVGGQNRVLARGAQAGDRLCVFDQGRNQFGCEIISFGDERLTLKKDESWQPVIKLSPVSSTTFELEVDGLPSGITNLKARLYPEFGEAFAEIGPLSESSGVYVGTINLDYPALSGNVQLWVDEGPDVSPYQNPRRETIVTYRVGGNPGQSRGSGGQSRGSGGQSRGSGGQSRGSGGQSRGSGGLVQGEGSAPAVSPDGQMTYFDRNFNLAEGQFYTVQDMAGLPALPEGKVAIGRGYNLFATGFATNTNPLTGSVSFQYLGNDVLTEEKSENELGIHFWDGSQWQALNTQVDTTYNLASAASEGPGVYALLAGVTKPVITAVTPSRAIMMAAPQLITITGSGFLTPTVVQLTASTATYTLPIQSLRPTTLTAVISSNIPAREYQVWVSNYNQPGAAAQSNPGVFALFDPANACFYDFFESGAGKWQTSGDWGIVTIVPSGERAMTDSPLGAYKNAGDFGPGLISQTTTVTSEAFSLTGCSEPVLAFRHDYVMANIGVSQDIGRVEISEDSGLTWTELATYTGGGVFGLNSQDVSGSEWSDVSWQGETIDLSAYTGTVRLRFSLEVDSDASDRGWILNDLLVQAGTGSGGDGNARVYLPMIVKEE